MSGPGAQHRRGDTAPSLERPQGHLPELQTAQLQGHALADLAGVALHVVNPELGVGRKAKVETPTLIPCFPEQRPQELAGALNTALSPWAVSLTRLPRTNT